MTAFQTAAAAIRARFDSNWTTTPKVYENMPYEETPGTAFVYFEVMWGDSFAASIGSTTLRKFRHAGTIHTNIFTPINNGPGLALQYADSIAAIFRGQNFSGVECFAPRIGLGRQDIKGNWWSVPLFCPFQYDADF